MRYFFSIILVMIQILTFAQYENWYQFNKSIEFTRIEKVGNTFWIGTNNSLIEYNINNNTYKKYNNANSGLHFNYITDVDADVNGKLWISTYLGINTLYNNEWVSYDSTNMPVTTGLYFTGIEMDSLNRVWIGSAYDGLFCFDGENITNYNTSNSGLYSNAIGDILFDNNGLMWFNNYFLMSYDGNEWIHHVPDDPENYMYGWDMDAIDKDNVIWGSSLDYCLLSYDGDEWIIYDDSISYDSLGRVRAVDEDNYKWILTSSGRLFKFRDNIWIEIPIVLPDEYPHIGFNDLTIDENGQIWLFGRKKHFELVIVKYENNEFTPIEIVQDSVPWKYITDIEIEDDSIPWICVTDGLYTYQDRTWSSYTTENSPLIQDNIRSILIDNNTKWLGTLDNLVKFNDDGWTIYDNTNSPLNNMLIYNLALDNNNKIWIAEGCLYAFDQENEWEEYCMSNSGLPYSYVSSIAIDSENNKWIGCQQNGVAVFDDENWIVYDTINSLLPNDEILCIIIDQNDVKWIGTKKGLARIEGEDWTVFKKENSPLPDNWICDLAFENDSILWIGTANGLVRFVEGDWEIFDLHNSGIHYNVVENIAIDGKGTKWITGGSSIRGISLYNENGLPDYNFIKSIDYLGKAIDINIYPNPSSGIIKIKIKIGENLFGKICVYSIQGKLLFTTKNKPFNKGLHNFSINLNSITQGKIHEYLFISFETSNYIYSKKVLLTN